MNEDAGRWLLLIDDNGTILGKLMRPELVPSEGDDPPKVSRYMPLGDRRIVDVTLPASLRETPLNQLAERYEVHDSRLRERRHVAE